MKFIDLHCDTIARIVGENLDFTKPETLHVTLPGIISSNTVVQVFACFVMSAHHPGQEFEVCNAYIDAIDALIKKHNDRLIPATSFKQLADCVASRGKTGILIAIEGATPLNGDPAMLEHFYQRGVRLLTIAWDDNAFCGTVFGNKSGLTKSGEELIRYCNELGVSVDVSHASDKAFYEIAAITKIPFVASHSNARAVCPNDRNLSDDMIKRIADTGGVIGLTYGSGFIQSEYYKQELVCRNKILKGFKDKSLTPLDAKKISHAALSKLADAPLPLLVEHARHMIGVGGEDCLALGSDFDGVDSLPRSLSGVHALPNLVLEMEKQGISPRVIDKICHGNALGYFEHILL